MELGDHVVFAKDRFWAKVEKTETCWLWTAARSHNGYGRFTVDGRSRKAHRVAYELVVGPIPEGLSIHHRCNTPACVRPDHLEPMPIGDNIRLGTAGRVGGARQRAKTRCPWGHAYAEGNVYITTAGGRQCRACERLRDRRRARRVAA